MSTYMSETKPEPTQSHRLLECDMSGRETVWPRVVQVIVTLAPAAKAPTFALVRLGAE